MDDAPQMEDSADTESVSKTEGMPRLEEIPRTNDVEDTENLDDEKDSSDEKDYSYKDAMKASFQRVAGWFAFRKRWRKRKEEMERLDNLSSFVGEDNDSSSPQEILEDGTFSQDKHLKKKASKVKGINLISLPMLLKRDCGMTYKWTAELIHYLVAFVIIALIGLAFKLEVAAVVVMAIVYLVFGPSLIYYHYRKKYELELFSECVRYVEQMLYSFTRKTKILTALQETRLVIHGRLGKTIDFAINKIQNETVMQGNIYTEALKEVEALLPCSRVKNLHEFLAEVENVGGKHTTALEIMLEDLREWDIRTGQFQQNQSVKNTGMLFSIIMSLGTCLFMTRILPADIGGDLSGIALYQWVTTIAIIVNFFIYRVVARKLTRSWVADDFDVNQEQVLEDYKKISDYFETKKGIKPIFAINRIKNELEKKFPRWVMRFALLASTRSIPSALRESIASCPNVMRAELEKLVEEIDKDPTGINPYLNFFGYLDMPQVRSMMLMVYSLSEYSTQDIDRHVLTIIKRNYALQATAETIENDESLARFSLYTTLPMIFACIIMMIDVVMLVLNMVSVISTKF